MSWSVSAVGKAAAVKASLESQFSSGKCPEPEESAKQLVRQALGVLLDGHTKTEPVRVSAGGSQSYRGGGTDQPITEVANSLSVSVEVLYGYVE